MRAFVELFVRRPVLALMLASLLVTLGILSYRALGVDLMPNVDFPVVTVTTLLKGAGPEEVEAGITRPLEEALNTIEGIDDLRATSMDGRSQVTVTFVLERKATEAAQDVRDKVAAVVGRLPDGTEAPVISRFNVDDSPIYQISVSGPRPMKELTDLARRRIKEVLETLQGVGAVDVIGGETRAVMVWADADRLAARSLSILDLSWALSSGNVEAPGGRIDQGQREGFLRTLGRIERARDFSTIYVASRDNVPILVQDLARVEDGSEEATSLSRYNGQRSVTVSVRKQTGTNTVEVVDGVRARMQRIRANLPQDIVTAVVRDQSDFIRRSVEGVEHHLLLGAALTALAVLLFLRSWRTTLVAALSIPASLVTTFAVMRAFDFTLNNMTLMALSVAVGIVVDDAIVVLENIVRHARKPGVTPIEAAISGTGEVGLAVTATTFSLVVIFLPVAFMEGRIGRFFHSFGITLTGAVLVSLVVAMTLTPPFTALALGKKGLAHHEGGWLYRHTEALYGRILAWSLRHRLLVTFTGLALALSTWPLYQRIGKDFMPNDDRSEFQVAVRTPEGTSIRGTDAFFGEVEAALGGLPEVRGLLTNVGERGDTTVGNLLVQLTDLEDRDISQFDIMRRARGLMRSWPGLRSSVQFIGNMGGGGFGGEVNITLRGSDPEELEDFAAAYLKRMRQVKGLVDVDSSAAVKRPEVRVHLDRQRAADMGVRVSDLGSALRAMVGGSIVSRYREGDEVMDVWLRLDAPYRDDPDALSSLLIPSARGLIPLSSVATLEKTLGPVQLDRVDRQRQITVYANLDGLDMGAAMGAMERVFKESDPPATVDYKFTGRSKSFMEAYTNFAMAFGLSLVFMYMILAAQFESLVLPVPILLSLPLSMPFALISLLALGDTLNVYSIFGLFLLAGVIKKNGILQVDRTLQLEREGWERLPAILEANRQRLRPILMTTLTLIAGMLPIALGEGPGAASRASMAKVIIGGQGLSLLITLLITPVTYSLLLGRRRV